MAKPQRIGDLEVDEDIDQQRKVWTIERIAWVVMALIILAALLGLLGTGPLSSVVLDQADTGLVVRYKRFERHKAASLIAASIAPAPQTDAQAEDSPTRLSIGRNFVEEYEINAIVPEPVAVEAWPEHLVYVFELPDQESPAEILIYISANKFGPVEIGMQLAGYRELRFKQFVYP